MLLIFLFNILTVPSIMGRSFDFMSKYASNYKSCAHCSYYYLPPQLPTPPTLMYKVKITYTQHTPGYLPPATPFKQPTPTPNMAPVPGIKQSTVEPTKPSFIPPTPVTTAQTTQKTTQTTVSTEITTAYTPVVITARTTPMFTTPRTAEATPDISDVVVVKLPETETKPPSDNTEDNVDISSIVVVKIPDGLSTATEIPSITNSPKTNVDTDIDSVVEVKIPDTDIDQYPTGRANEPATAVIDGYVVIEDHNERLKRRQYWRPINEDRPPK